MGENAFPAPLALLTPYTLLIKSTEESGVQRGNHGKAAEGLGQGLNSGAAGKRQDDISVGRYVQKVLQKVRFALPLDCPDLNGAFRTPGALRSAKLAGERLSLPVAA
jgi:hypothetical protein